MLFTMTAVFCDAMQYYLADSYHHTTWCHILEDCGINIHCRQNLESQML
jgi:hypothetical protein